MKASGIPLERSPSCGAPGSQPFRPQTFGDHNPRPLAWAMGFCAFGALVNGQTLGAGGTPVLPVLHRQHNSAAFFRESAQCPHASKRVESRRSARRANPTAGNTGASLDVVGRPRRGVPLIFQAIAWQQFPLFPQKQNGREFLGSRPVPSGDFSGEIIRTPADRSRLEYWAAVRCRRAAGIGYLSFFSFLSDSAGFSAFSAAGFLGCFLAGFFGSGSGVASMTILSTHSM